MVNEHKVVKGTNYNGAWDSWYGPEGDRNPKSYDVNKVRNCQAGVALKFLNLLPETEKIRFVQSIILLKNFFIEWYILFGTFFVCFIRTPYANFCRLKFLF